MVIHFFLLLFLLFFTSLIFFIMHAACILIGLIYFEFVLLIYCIYRVVSGRLRRIYRPYAACYVYSFA